MNVYVNVFMQVEGITWFGTYGGLRQDRSVLLNPGTLQLLIPVRNYNRGRLVCQSYDCVVPWCSERGCMTPLSEHQETDYTYIYRTNKPSPT